MLFASVDPTERRRAEEARLALEERLQQAEKLEAIGRLHERPQRIREATLRGRSLVR